ncbi:Uncharacterized HNH endonuclease L247 [Durusdinium trenchii]|uniref:Uncharacterized HNH endonuclease L247 n=1 Tax=Durusdinium trenchii TaxID=1381693 RepID=A0ABP0MZC8_9DINO
MATSIRPGHAVLHFGWQQLSFSRYGRSYWSVSSHGRCRTLTGQITLGTLQPSGYRRVRIAGQLFFVHRVVAQAFLGYPPNDKSWQVHHRDGNPSNNRLDNLEYTTPSENMLHFHSANLLGRSVAGRSLPVMWRVLGSQDWATCPSIKCAARQLGMRSQTISACRKDGSLVGSYEFKFADPLEPPVLPGERWVPMVSPATGLEVGGRQVSSAGRFTVPGGRISRGYQRRGGYFKTSIGNRMVYVHRLVARAFLGPPPPMRSQVNHKDCHPGNNNLENLEYVTPAENTMHALSNPQIRQRHKEANSKPVLGRRWGSKDEWRWFPSMAAAAEAVGVSPSAMSQCLRRESRRTGKYEFRLATEDTPAEEIPDEEWRMVDFDGLVAERRSRCSRP